MDVELFLRELDAAHEEMMDGGDSEYIVSVKGEGRWFVAIKYAGLRLQGSLDWIAGERVEGLEEDMLITTL